MTSHICLAWGGEKHKWTDRQTFSGRPRQTHREAASFKISRSIISYSDIHSNYCLFPQAEWICNFFHLLESWQFDNCWGATAVLAASVLPLKQCLGFSCQSNQSLHTLVPLCSSAFFVLTHVSCSCLSNSALKRHTSLSARQLDLNKIWKLYLAAICRVKCIISGSALTFPHSAGK